MFKNPLLGSLYVVLFLVAQPVISVELPFYFSVPESGWGQLPKSSKVYHLPVSGYEDSPVGLRIMEYRDAYPLSQGSVKKSATSVIKRKRKFRAQVTRELSSRGLLKHGDVVLSLRPEWAKTSPYPHLQMGISHAGLIVEKNGNLINLDMPLDSDYNGMGLTSELNANHYLETDVLHILRPRKTIQGRLRNLNHWVSTLDSNYWGIRKNGLLKFNSDYSAPKFNHYNGDALSFVDTLGEVVSGENASSKDLTLYCSEFVWSMMTLSNCPTQETDGCIQPVFMPMPMVSRYDSNGDVTEIGLTEGPYEILHALNGTNEEKYRLIEELFTEGELKYLSRGHRKLATSPEIKQLIASLEGYYVSKLKYGPNNGTKAEQMAKTISATRPLNYSPTAFLVNTFLPENNPQRAYDYIATVVFK